MAKKTIWDVINAGEFIGSFSKLERLCAQEQGEWIDRGGAKVFVIESSEVIWWPDTGDVLHAIYPKPFAGIVRRKWWTSAKRSASGSRWKTFRHNALGKISLPELLFRDQHKFFGLPLLSYSALDIDEFEYGEIYAKISAIRIPKWAPRESRVVHKFIGDRHEGFSLSTLPTERVRQRGEVIVERHIDIMRGHQRFPAMAIDQAAISSLLRILDPGFSGSWDRKMCEAFFDDDSNFLFSTRKSAAP